MVFHPPRTLGLAVGAAALLLLLLLDVGCVLVLRARPLSPIGFGALVVLLASLPALACIIYRTLGLARARYVVSRNALVAEWGGRRLVLPMASLIEARLGGTFESALRLPRLSWPGNHVGRAEVESLGPVEYLASSDQRGLVVVRHDGGVLALSPSEPQVFLDALVAAQAEGPEQDVPAEATSPAFTHWELWHDRLALGLIGLGGLGALLLLGYLALISGQLPAQIALHFNALGQPDRFGPPTGLLILPLIAVLAWLVNTALGLWLYRGSRERPAAYLLLGATIFVQALVWVATIGLLTAGSA